MHLKNFQLETLFYIFYSMSQDLYQVSTVHAGVYQSFICVVRGLGPVLRNGIWLFVLSYFVVRRTRMSNQLQLLSLSELDFELCTEISKDVELKTETE